MDGNKNPRLHEYDASQHEAADKEPARKEDNASVIAKAATEICPNGLERKEGRWDELGKSSSSPASATTVEASFSSKGSKVTGGRNQESRKTDDEILHLREKSVVTDNAADELTLERATPLDDNPLERLMEQTKQLHDNPLEMLLEQTKQLQQRAQMLAKESSQGSLPDNMQLLEENAEMLRNKIELEVMLQKAKVVLANLELPQSSQPSMEKEFSLNDSCRPSSCTSEQVSTKNQVTDVTDEEDSEEPDGNSRLEMLYKKADEITHKAALLLGVLHDNKDPGSDKSALNQDKNVQPLPESQLEAYPSWTSDITHENTGLETEADSPKPSQESPTNDSARNTQNSKIGDPGELKTTEIEQEINNCGAKIVIPTVTTKKKKVPTATLR